ncbi:MAG: extracellular solute-binding protein [Planctomycetota bacterium]
MLVPLFVLLACGGERADATARVLSAAPATAPATPHTLVVFATASLRAPFAALAGRYEQDHPGAKVDLHVDGGAQLFAQANSGAPFDVVAIGDSSLMSRFASSALLAAHSATELARNRIAIAVAPGNPKQVQSLRDLVRPDLLVALGARSSSIGRHARWALSRHNLVVEPKADGAHADALLARVKAGEVDAAVVYVTSFRGVDGVTMVAIPEAENTPVLYSISAARTAAEPRGAAAFRELALGEVGQAMFREHGFLPIGAK